MFWFVMEGDTQATGPDVWNEIVWRSTVIKPLRKETADFRRTLNGGKAEELRTDSQPLS